MVKNKAFTLIELLVVIAIIGLLASIVLLNMRGYTGKARDANIKSFFHQIRNAAEFSYIKNNESYALVCDESDNTLSNVGEFGFLKNAIMKETDYQSVKCFVSADEKNFAVSSPLSTGKHWCVEEAGAATEIDGPVSSDKCQ